MTRHLREAGAFGVRMGPPVVTRRWDAAAVKAGGRRRRRPHARRGAADRAAARRAPAWSRSSRSSAGGCRAPRAGSPPGSRGTTSRSRCARRPTAQADRTEDDVLKGMNQQWRRNIKKAAKAGVEVSRRHRGGPQGVPRPLRAHRRARRLHAAAAGATSRRCSARCSAEEPDRIRLFLARHEGDLVAATIWVRVGGHTWYSYGASSTEKRDVRGSNAAQWAMIQAPWPPAPTSTTCAASPTPSTPTTRTSGLIQFKVGTGGEAVEYAGEWDLPLNAAALQGVLGLHGAGGERRPCR